MKHPPSEATDPSALLGVPQLLDAAPEPKILIGPGYVIAHANAAYRKRYGDGAVGKRCFEVSHGIDRPCDEAGEDCPLKRAALSRSPARVVHLHHTPRGDEHVDVHLVPLLSGGVATHFVETMTDVSLSRATPDSTGLIGRSPAFTRMLDAIQKVAPSDASVLLLGETGTGKELVAKAIHLASHRQGGPFVPVDCSGIPDTLFESELFGHERGAFTGAQLKKKGLAEAAQGGTLFLDEIGDMPLAQQVKLLRLIETGTYRRVGGVEPIRADFRLVCATHQDLTRQVAEGGFRQDLYFRVSVFPITLPPLRERLSDVPLLTQGLLQRMRPGRAVRLSTAAVRELARHDFPGNVRELRNVLERALLLSASDTIDADAMRQALPTGQRASPGSRRPHVARATRPSPVEILELADKHRGPLRSLAAELGLSERTLYRHLAEARRLAR